MDHPDRHPFGTTLAPAGERQRLQALWRLDLLDTAAEERFDRLVRLAARTFQVPIALVSLVDEERCWFKSRQGLDASEAPRSISFCDRAVRCDDTFIVEDAQADPRFADNPLVTGAPHVRFYAGQPLYTPDDEKVGFLVVIDTVPRSLSPGDLEALKDFAHLVEREMNGEAATRAALENHNQLLGASNEALAAQQEEIAAVNEELRQQAEELAAQQEEVVAVNEELRQQTELLTQLSEGLSARRAFLERILATVPSGVGYLDRELYFRFSNAPYAGFLGHTPESLDGLYLDEAAPGAVEQTGPWLRETMRTFEPFSLQNFCLVIHEPTGDRHTYWDFVYYPDEPDEDGIAKGVFVIADEISERLAAERERVEAQRARISALEEANRHKEQFLGILSHELRTPLNAIQGFGSVLEDGVCGELSAPQTEYLGRMMIASDHMLALIDDLLDFSRMQAGHFALSIEATAIAPPARQALGELAAAAADKALTLVDAVPDGLPAVSGDAQRIRQIVSNLVTNAIKYTPAGGTITVSASADAEVVRVTVADTGIGVAPEHQARIFESFTQVDMSNTRARGGVGLGLSIVKALVDAHGGEVGVDSPGLEAGSTFWFTLPIQAT